MIKSLVYRYIEFELNSIVCTGIEVMKFIPNNGIFVDNSIVEIRDLV